MLFDFCNVDENNASDLSNYISHSFYQVNDIGEQFLHSLYGHLDDEVDIFRVYYMSIKRTDDKILFDMSNIGTGERINTNTVTRGFVEQYDSERNIMYKFYGEIIDNIMYVITIDHVIQDKKPFVGYDKI